MFCLQGENKYRPIPSQDEKGWNIQLVNGLVQNEDVE